MPKHECPVTEITFEHPPKKFPALLSPVADLGPRNDEDKFIGIAPTLGTIFVGQNKSTHPNHACVRASIGELDHIEIGNGYDFPLVDGWIKPPLNNPTYLLRIESFEVKDRNPEKMAELLELYRGAIELAEEQAKKVGGHVALQADGPSQKLIAKILGRLHLVEEAEVKQERSKTGIPHLYNRNTGTRYFAIGALEDLARESVFSAPADSSKGQITSLLAQHRATIESKLRELSHLINPETKNRMGNQEGCILIVHPSGRSVEKATDSADDRCGDINDLLHTWTSSDNAHEPSSRFQKSFEEVLIKWKESCHPSFHKINLKSPLFYDLAHRLLRSDSETIDLGADISTPIKPVKFGEFTEDKEGKRGFILSTENQKLHDIGHWLFSEPAKTYFQRKQIPLPSDCYYICAYIPLRQLTFESHPTDFVERFGDLKPDSFVIEFGKVGEKPTRLVIEDNVWAPKRCGDRQTEFMTQLLQSHSPLEFSAAVHNFKDAQQKLFSQILSTLSETKVSLAEPYEWVTIPRTGSTSDSTNKSEDADNFRVRLYVDGARADLVSDWKLGPLTDMMPILADLMAVGVVAQISQIPRRDLVIQKDASGIKNVVLLSVGETLCNSAKAEDAADYLRGIVPNLVGNLVAHFVTQVAHSAAQSSDSGKDKQQEMQELLIKSFTTRFKARLKELSESAQRDDRTPIDSEPLGVLNAVIGEASSRPKPRGSIETQANLDIVKHLPLSLSILKKLSEKRARDELGDAITKVATNELELIGKLASGHRDIDGSSNQSRIDIALAGAVSSILETHLSEPEYYQKAKKHLSTLSELKQLSAEEKLWSITLFDVSLRMSELHQVNDFRMAVAAAFTQAQNDSDFCRIMNDKMLPNNLSDDTIRGCYRAIEGFRRSFAAAHQRTRKRDLLKALGELKSFGGVIRRPV